MSFDYNAVIQQLGGRRFIAMTGAKHFVFDNEKRALAFSIGRGAAHGINRVRVTLNAADLYNVEFFKLRGVDCVTVAGLSDVYAENLPENFTRITGFDTRL